MNSTTNGTWRTSTRSATGSNCAEIGSYRTSTFSQGASNCIEAGQGNAVIGIRDTKQAKLGTARTVLEVSPAAWSGFLAWVRAQ